VIGHHIEDLAEIVLAQGVDVDGIVGVAADLGVEALVIEHVVAVRAAGAGLQVGRSVDVADAEIVQIGSELGGVLEGEAGVKLQAIGCFRRAASCRRFALHVGQQVGQNVRVGHDAPRL